MKILQINSAKNFGGGEKHLLDLMSGLVDAGHEVFLASREKKDWSGKLEKLNKVEKFSIGLHNAFDLPSAWKLAKIVRKSNIEIIHAHVARDYPLAVLASMLAGNDAAVILSRHVLFPMKTIHKYLLNKVSAVIAVSKAVETQLHSQKVFAKDKIRFISNSVNLDAAGKNAETNFQDFRRLYNLDAEESLVTTVGELKSLKGQTEFLQAAAAISQEFPKTKFAVVGKDNSNNQSFKKCLESQAAELKLTGKILWIEHCEEVSSLLAATDIFVSASHTESFGLAILEALAAGCPIVATETAGAKEILLSETTGKLVPIHQPAAMARAVNEFLALKKDRKTFEEAALKIIEARFSFRQMINLTEQLYLECLEVKRQKNLVSAQEISILPENHFAQP